MTFLVGAAQDLREKRAGQFIAYMLWVGSKHRETHVNLGVGLWTGRTNRTIRVRDAVTGVLMDRLFEPGLGDPGDIEYQIGFEVQTISLNLVSTSIAVRRALREYEAQNASAQLSSWTADPDTKELVGVEDLFFGFVDTLEFTEPEVGGSGAAVLTVASTARSLSIPSPMKKSDVQQRKRTIPGRGPDKIRQYKATMRNRDVPWGGKG